MLDNLESSKRRSEHKVCPHLALIGDEESYAAYPSSINACYLSLYPVTPRISHQNNYCLNQNYLKCPLFNNEQTSKFPKEIRYKSKFWSGNRKIIFIMILFFILVIMLVLTFIFRGGFGNSTIGLVEPETLTFSSSSIEKESTSIPTEILLNSKTAELENSTQTTITLMVTRTPILTISTKSDPILALDKPIGGDKQFIIHRVLDGESLQYLADTYNTSVQEIIAVNENLVTPLWIGGVIVIPFNISNFDGLPAFSAYRVEEEEITIKDLAEELDVSLDGLALYNNLDVEHLLKQDEWLLIPGD